MQDSAELRKQSARLRGIFLRFLEPLFIFIAAVLLLTTIPYWSVTFSILFSLFIAGLAFKWRVPAVFLLFLFAMPGYIYQGGFPGVMVGSIVGALFIVSVTCIGAPGTALGIATGVIAAMIMFTPLWFLSIPLILGVALFRNKGIKVGVAEAILVFLIFYLPFVVLETDPLSGEFLPLSVEEPAPLFERVTFEMESLKSTIEPNDIYDNLKDRLGSNEHIIDNMAFYWPIHGMEGRLLGLWLLFVFGISISVSFIALAMIDWFKQRIEEIRYLNWWAQTIALLAANLIFLIPIVLMQSDFDYSVQFGPGTVFGYIVATVAIGNAGSGIQRWMSRHERLIDLQLRVDNLLNEIRDQNEKLVSHVIEVRAVCTGIDLFAEKAVGDRCHQEMAFIVSNMEAMDTATLNDKIELLYKLRKSISEALKAISRKLQIYISDSRNEYRELLSWASDFGFSFEDDDHQVRFSRQSFPDDDSVLEEQKKMNLNFENLGQTIVTSGEEIRRIVKNEVDPEFVAISMDIAQNLLETGHYQEATDASLSAMSTAERLIANAASGLTVRLDEAIKGLQSTIKTSIVPAIESTNDPALAGSFNEEFVKLQKLRFPEQPGRKLMNLLQVVKATKELSDWTTLIIDKLCLKIQGLEEEIDTMVPSGYGWGKTGFVVPKDNTVSAVKNGNKVGTALDNSMTAIEMAIQTIEQEASIIKQYMSIREFIINYPNIEYLLEEKLRLQGQINVEEIPVKQDYAMRYFQLYAQKNFRDVSFDSRSGILIYRNE